MTAVPAWQAPCEALYRQHAGRILRTCRLLLNDSQEAQDVAQEVFLKLWHAYPVTEHPMRWEGWLVRVTVNACRERRRTAWWRWGRAQDQPIEDLSLIDPAPTPERAVAALEARHRLWEHFYRLPARQREVVTLRYVEGWSTKEIAEALRLSPGTVKRHLFRATHRLRAALGGNA